MSILSLIHNCVQDIVHSFPEYTREGNQLLALSETDLLAYLNDRIPPLCVLVLTQNPTFFSHAWLPYLPWSTLWAQCDTDPVTQQALWAHVQTIVTTYMQTHGLASLLSEEEKEREKEGATEGESESESEDQASLLAFFKDLLEGNIGTLATVLAEELKDDMHALLGITVTDTVTPTQLMQLFQKLSQQPEALHQFFAKVTDVLSRKMASGEFHPAQFESEVKKLMQHIRSIPYITTLLKPFGIDLNELFGGGGKPPSETKLAVTKARSQCKQRALRKHVQATMAAAAAHPLLTDAELITLFDTPAVKK